MTRTSPGRQMFPEVFTKFLEDNDIDSAIYSLESDCRYIYVIDQTKIKQEDLFIDFPSGVKEVKGVPGFYRLQKPFLSNCIASSKLYNDGLILPLDTASGMAVHALEIKEGDHILDLCCAPGTKLVMMASKMGSSGTITGVDISRHRIFNVRALVKKYKVDNVRIYNENGTSFKRPIFLPKVGGERFKDVIDRFGFCIFVYNYCLLSSDRFLLRVHSANTWAKRKQRKNLVVC